MAHAQFNVGLKVILKNSEGKVLALKAHTNGPMKDYYDLPGGRVDDDEVGKSFVEILKREITEELGPINYELNTNPITALSWLWPNGQAMTFIYWEAEYKNGDITTGEEHLGHEWIEPTDQELDKYFTTYHRQAFKNIKTPSS